ncbi:MAG TPA: PH domain-containing protein [Bacillota bacterium]|nr:PH domain-containing protein [Bacillota bacterium]
MPYCSGCGSRYQEGDKVCKSCGFELMEDVDPKTAGKSSTAAAKKERATTVTKKPTRKKKTTSEAKPDLTEANPQNPPLNESGAPQVVTGSSETRDKRQLQSEVIAMPAVGLNDIHLGKGIIKPKAVEVGLDGFHFKYEEQPHSFKKSDTFSKEHGAELRVVNPDFEKDRVNLAVPNETAPMEELKLQPEAPEAPEDREQNSPPPETEKSSPLTDSNLTGESTDGNIESVLQDTLEAELREMVNLLEESEIDNEAEPANVDVEQQMLKQLDESMPVVVDDEEETKKISVPEPLEVKSVEVDLPKDGATDLRKPEPPLQTSEAMEEPEKEYSEPTQPIEVVEVCQAQETTIAINDNVTVFADTVQSQSIGTQPSGTLSEKNTVNILWQGHQSWFGIPLPNHICLSEQRLTLTEQNGQIVEITVDQIKHITVKQSWLAKLLGIGDLVIDLKQRVPSRQILTGVSNPVKLRMLLEDLVSKAV